MQSFSAVLKIPVTKHNCQRGKYSWGFVTISEMQRKSRYIILFPFNEFFLDQFWSATILKYGNWSRIIGSVICI